MLFKEITAFFGITRHTLPTAKNAGFRNVMATGNYSNNCAVKS
jgi:hypothetical protein